MNLGDLLDTAREISGDSGIPPGTSDAEFTRYANEGVREAARRARLLVDSTTAAVCQIALTSTDATYAMDSRVLFIRRAKLTGRSLPLSPISYKDLDRQAPDWQTETGEPSHFVQDMDKGLFRPYPSPDAAGTVTLTVIRLPLADMSAQADTPELQAHLHEGIVNWMLWRHFSKPDIDIEDLKRAAYHLDLFEAEFGKKSSAIDEEWIRTQYGYGDDEGVF